MIQKRYRETLSQARVLFGIAALAFLAVTVESKELNTHETKSSEKEAESFNSIEKADRDIASSESILELDVLLKELHQLADKKPLIPPVEQRLAMSAKYHLSRSPCKDQRVLAIQDPNAPQCDTVYDGKDLRELTALVGDLRIESCTPELIQHLQSWYPGLEDISITLSTAGRRPAIDALEKFGSKTVPLFLERLRKEKDIAEDSDFQMDVDHYFVAAYGYEWAPDRVQELAKVEKHGPTREFLVMLIPHLEYMKEAERQREVQRKRRAQWKKNEE